METYRALDIIAERRLANSGLGEVLKEGILVFTYRSLDDAINERDSKSMALYNNSTKAYSIDPKRSSKRNMPDDLPHKIKYNGMFKLNPCSGVIVYCEKEDLVGCARERYITIDEIKNKPKQTFFERCFGANVLKPETFRKLHDESCSCGRLHFEGFETESLRNMFKNLHDLEDYNDEFNENFNNHLDDREWLIKMINSAITDHIAGLADPGPRYAVLALGIGIIWRDEWKLLSRNDLKMWLEDYELEAMERGVDAEDPDNEVKESKIPDSEYMKSDESLLGVIKDLKRKQALLLKFVEEFIWSEECRGVTYPTCYIDGEHKNIEEDALLNWKKVEVPDIDMSKVPFVCHFCKSNPCECIPISNPPIQLNECIARDETKHFEVSATTLVFNTVNKIQSACSICRRCKETYCICMTVQHSSAVNKILDWKNVISFMDVTIEKILNSDEGSLTDERRFKGVVKDVLEIIGMLRGKSKRLPATISLFKFFIKRNDIINSETAEWKRFKGTVKEKIEEIKPQLEEFKDDSELIKVCEDTFRRLRESLNINLDDL